MRKINSNIVFILVHIAVAIITIGSAILGLKAQGFDIFFLAIVAIGVTWFISFTMWYFDDKAKNEKKYFIDNFKKVIDQNESLQQAFKDFKPKK